ncbi:MAG: CvpA family protein [Clostridia bacterium]|nr:CvpA family protein [Clostridia bacterium]
MMELFNLGASVAANYIVDGIVAVFFLVMVFACAKKGFITCMFGFVSTLVCIIVAMSLAKSTVSATGGLFGLQSALETKFIETFSGLTGFNVDISGQNLEEALATQNLSSIIATLVVKNYSGQELAAGTTLGMLVGRTTAELTTNLIAGVAVFLVLKFVIALVKKLINAIVERIGLFDALNKLLGAIVGLIEAVLIVSLIMSVLTLVPSEGIIAFFDKSLILGWLYHHNPLVVMLGWFI